MWPQHVDPVLIDAQRERGWPDFHPEDFCHRCGNRNLSWHVDADTWNTVMRGGDPAGWGDWQEIICPPCFTELAEPHGFTAWHLSRDTHGILALAPERKDHT